MTAREYARNAGFEGVQEMPSWRGYKCYEAIVSEPESVNDVPMIGFPQIILEKDEKFRFADYDEAMKYIQSLQED